MTEWIDSDSKTRSPLVGKGITDALTGRSWAADKSFLLPTNAKQTSDVLVEAPRVLCVPRVVVGESTEARCAKLGANDLKAHRYLCRCTIGQQDGE